MIAQRVRYRDVADAIVDEMNVQQHVLLIHELSFRMGQLNGMGFDEVASLVDLTRQAMASIEQRIRQAVSDGYDAAVAP